MQDEPALMPPHCSTGLVLFIDHPVGIVILVIFESEVEIKPVFVQFAEIANVVFAFTDTFCSAYIWGLNAALTVVWPVSVKLWPVEF